MQRALGLDVGDRRIGVALSDPIGITAQPLTVLERQGSAKDVDAVCALAQEHGVGVIVVGLPLTLRGERGPQAQKVVSFADALRRRMAMPVQLMDERLTTVQGERALLDGGVRRQLRKQVIDRVAAQLILQSFLDVQANRTTD